LLLFKSRNHDKKNEETTAIKPLKTKLPESVNWVLNNNIASQTSKMEKFVKKSVKRIVKRVKKQAKIESKMKLIYEKG
jgi:regulator of sirC expression with transglutaminase-like and TPR domain